MRLKAIRTEALWLLGCYAVAFLLVRVLTGFWVFGQSTLDIQLHNTYFILDNMWAILPLFVPVALAVTGARAIAEPLRTRYTWLVLLLLCGLALLIILFIMPIATKIIH